MISSHGAYFTKNSLEVAIDDLIVARFPSARELRDNADAVAELLFDSIEIFAIRTGIRTTRFADAYSAAVRITLGTLAKPHLRGVCRFERLPVEAALRWVKSRLLSNLKTVLSNPQSTYWLGRADREQVAAEHVTFGNAEIEAELDRMTAEQVAGGLRAMFLDGEDLAELEYLADRFGIDLAAVIGRHEVAVVCEKTVNGNAQIAFDWGV